MDRYADMVYADTTKEFEAEVVDEVFGFMDGLNLPGIFNPPEDPNIQNAYYNGRRSGTHGYKLIVFISRWPYLFREVR